MQSKQRILVYGAGVLGCYFVHKLMETQEDVTLLARGRWADTLEQDGLMIKHSPQQKTTLDQVRVIRYLDNTDIYDIIFVTMQYTQVPEIIDILKNNRSKRIVFIGNNADPMRIEVEFENSDKDILFGFLSAGGRREDGKVFSVHMKDKFTVGCLSGMISEEQQDYLKGLFHSSDMAVCCQEDMMSWLYTHLAFILPMCYACYAVNGKLKKMTKEMKNQIIDAVCEEYDVIIDCGFSIVPAGEYEYAKNNRKAFMKFLWILSKTFIGKLAISDHAMHAVAEMKQLSADFQKLNEQSKLQKPNYDILRKYIEEYPDC